MENEDIIGKEIIGFEFEDYPMLKYNSHYEKLEGKKGVIVRIHKEYPEYTEVEFKDEKGYCSNWHYPTELIKEHLAPPVDLNDLFNQIKNYGS